MALTLNHCRNCGYLTENRYCGNPECMEALARGVASQRAWGGRAMLLALILATATALFIAFFNNQGWQDRVLVWAFENGRYDIAVHIVERRWGGFMWDELAAVGVVATALLAGVWLLTGLSAGLKLRAVPNLHSATKDELARRWRITQLVGALAMLPILTTAAAAVAGAASLAAGGWPAHRRHEPHAD